MGFGSFLKSVVGSVAPVVGGILGGPVGTAIGTGVSGYLSNSGVSGAASGGFSEEDYKKQLELQRTQSNDMAQDNFDFQNEITGGRYSDYLNEYSYMSPTEEGLAQRDTLQSAFPELNPWELAGSGTAGISGATGTNATAAADAAGAQKAQMSMQAAQLNTQKQMQEKQLSTDLAIAKMNNQTQLQTTQLNNQASNYAADTSSNASMYGSDTSAAASRYGTDVNSQTSELVARINTEPAYRKLPMELKQLGAQTALTVEQGKLTTEQATQQMIQNSLDLKFGAEFRNLSNQEKDALVNLTWRKYSNEAYGSQAGKTAHDATNVIMGAGNYVIEKGNQLIQDLHQQGSQLWQGVKGIGNFNSQSSSTKRSGSGTVRRSPAK